MTVTVWVLVFFMGSGAAKNGGPGVVDNIANERECHKLARAIQGTYSKDTPTSASRC